MFALFRLNHNNGDPVQERVSLPYNNKEDLIKHIDKGRFIPLAHPDVFMSPQPKHSETRTFYCIIESDARCLPYV